MFTYFNAFMKGYTSSSDMTVQQAEKPDLSVLADIHAASFKHAWSDGELEKMLSNKNYLCLAAYPPRTAKSRPAGFVFIRSILDEAEIITIATDPAKRKKGVARKLLQEAIRKLQFDRKKKLFLEVDETNKAAIKLYKSLHFEQVGEREGYYSSAETNKAKKPTALVMQLELG